MVLINQLNFNTTKNKKLKQRDAKCVYLFDIASEHYNGDEKECVYTSESYVIGQMF
jgi:hypothetical protein